MKIITAVMFDYFEDNISVIVLAYKEGNLSFYHKALLFSMSIAIKKNLELGLQRDDPIVY